MDTYRTTSLPSFINFMHDCKPARVTVSTEIGEESGVSYYVNRNLSLFTLLRAQFKGSCEGEPVFCEYRFVRRIKYQADSKKVLLETLRELQVSEEDIQTLKKLSTRKILDIAVTSHAEDDEETSVREKTESSVFSIKVGRAKVVISPDTSQRHTSPLHVDVELDYSDEVAHQLDTLRNNLPDRTKILEEMAIDNKNAD